MPGAPQTLSRTEYLSDSNFLNIDSKLRRDQNLQGWDLVGVTRQVVNGFIYVLTYRNQQGATLTYRIIVSRNGDLDVQEPKREPASEPVPTPVPTPMPGAPSSVSRAEYTQNPKYVNLDSRIRRENGLQGFDLIEVTTQLVNGFNHVFTYRNPQGTTVRFTVY